VIFIKRNNLLNLCILFLTLFTLFLFDKTKLNKYIGYQKVKEYILIDYNFNPLVSKVFGKGIYSFYNSEVMVNNTILKEYFINDYYIVYQSEEILYSTYVGSVANIVKRDMYYDVYINLGSEELVIYNLCSTNLKLYQKIEANTPIGYLPFDIEGYYYYYQKH
jgi:hypothetical protein